MFVVALLLGNQDAEGEVSDVRHNSAWQRDGLLANAPVAIVERLLLRRVFFGLNPVLLTILSSLISLIFVISSFVTYLRWIITFIRLRLFLAILALSCIFSIGTAPPAREAAYNFSNTFDDPAAGLLHSQLESLAIWDSFSSWSAHAHPVSVYCEEEVGVRGEAFKDVTVRLLGQILVNVRDALVDETIVDQAVTVDSYASKKGNEVNKWLVPKVCFTLLSRSYFFLVFHSLLLVPFANTSLRTKFGRFNYL